MCILIAFEIFLIYKKEYTLSNGYAISADSLDLIMLSLSLRENILKLADRGVIVPGADSLVSLRVEDTEHIK